ncbi:hypothetical protein [Lactococcus cremoris]|uniref:hypothetical protein n=1 Tax=Lactococcus lactis subsp. cremoris TaxID=1359 RepID=UPI0005831170|nr:hypothetical protein [Lactococcus cremoris]KGH33744.1 hypothetical protein JL36_02985 [Lactococcus cremoris]QSE64321.1 hypothetical protein JWR96_04145 [Lactococcus cremoris]
MSELKHIAKGANGQVEAYDDKIVITRKGFLGVVTQGLKGDRTIYYSDLKGIEYKKTNICSKWIHTIYYKC